MYNYEIQTGINLAYNCTFLYSQKTEYDTMLDIVFLVWMRTGSKPPDINRFLSDTGIDTPQGCRSNKPCLNDYLEKM